MLSISAFWLGACPFSVWVGQWLLGKDIRDFGDGNPGAANVFRAGGRKAGCLALFLDIAKGAPFVALAHSAFRLSEAIVMVVALSAILGHAFSPMLRFRGGKSLAVTGGALLAMPEHEIFASIVIFMLVGFLLIDGDGWIVMLGTTASLTYLVATGATQWQLVFMLCLLAILGIKHFDELKTPPRPGGRLTHWFQSRKREA